MFSTSSNKKIGLIDSGIGGLSVYQSLAETLPHFSYIYLADYAYHPYGTLSEEDLSSRVISLGQNFVKKFSLDILVIACNTASTITLQKLRNKLSIPVIGVVPAIKPAAENSKSGLIGLLATKATSKNPYTKNLIEKYAPNCQVISVGSHLLVQWAEAKIWTQNDPPQHNQGSLPPSLAIVKRELQDILLHEEVDMIVLGCTHFPFIKEELQSFFSVGVQLLDSGAAIAKRLQEMTGHLPRQTPKKTKTLAVFTANPNPNINFTDLEKRLKERFHIEELKLWQGEIENKTAKHLPTLHSFNPTNASKIL